MNQHSATPVRELAARFGLRRIGRDWRGRCPACGYSGGLTLSEGQGGRVLWWCASCRDQAAVSAALGHPPAPAGRPLEPPAASDATARTALAARLWHSALPAEGTVVASYLAGRGGLTLPPGVPVRLLPGAKHPAGHRWPVMLGLVSDGAARPVAVHRTFLMVDGRGKAPVTPPRMTLGPVAGGAVRLHPFVEGAPLVIAEGIETALAASVLLGAPAWAAISAGNLADSLTLPAGVSEVILAVDHDPPGRAAAARATARFRAEGRRVRLAMPDKPNTDFNDVLCERGIYE